MAQNKRAGKKSLAANDFLAPSAPINVSATDVGTNRAYNSGAAVVSFSLPAGSEAATGFTVTASTGQSASGASSPITVTGIPIGNVTFTVVGANANGVGQSTTTTAIAITTVPAAPTGVTATSGVGAYDTISWTAPANGGKAISNYYVTSSDGKTANTTVSTGINISQEQGTSQTYTVYADNANGRSTASTASSSVTTFSFTPFSFAPYSFVPYSFVPYSFTPYSFTPFSFAPYSFAPKFGPRVT